MRNPAEDGVFQIVNWLQIQIKSKSIFVVSPRWNMWQWWSLLSVHINQILTLCKRFLHSASWQKSKLQLTF